MATAGIVVGLYQRCGFGVDAGRCSSVCTSITLRWASGAACSILSMKSSYPRPFWTTSCAPATSAATFGLDSNECGSVFGLLMTAVTVTYEPPIWPMTLAYSFSAPTATTRPPFVAAPATPAEPASPPTAGSVRMPAPVSAVPSTTTRSTTARATMARTTMARTSMARTTMARTTSRLRPLMNENDNHSHFGCPPVPVINEILGRVGALGGL